MLTTGFSKERILEPSQELRAETMSERYSGLEF